MGNKVKVLVAVVALLVGLGLLLYPYASNLYNQHIQAQVADQQDEVVAATGSARLEAERQAALDYNKTLLGNMTVISDPFDPRYEAPNEDDYNRVLNLGDDGVMGTLFIPKIELRLPVYHGTTASVLQKGVGHLERTSVPIGGPSAHAVLSGHTGLPSMEIFDKIDRLGVGDYFVMRVLSEDHAYEVKSVEVVLPEETDSLKIIPGKDQMTLVTCTPYGVNSHRLLVHAERTDLPQEWLDAESNLSFGPRVAQEALLPFTLIGVAIAIGVIAGRVALRRPWSRGKSSSSGKTEKLGKPGELLGKTGKLKRLKPGKPKPEKPKPGALERLKKLGKSHREPFDFPVGRGDHDKS